MTVFPIRTPLRPFPPPGGADRRVRYLPGSFCFAVPHPERSISRAVGIKRKITAVRRPIRIPARALFRCELERSAGRDLTHPDAERKCAREHGETGFRAALADVVKLHVLRGIARFKHDPLVVRRGKKRFEAEQIDVPDQRFRGQRDAVCRRHLYRQKQREEEATVAENHSRKLSVAVRVQLVHCGTFPFLPGSRIP